MSVGSPRVVKVQEFEKQFTKINTHIDLLIIFKFLSELCFLCVYVNVSFHTPSPLHIIFNKQALFLAAIWPSLSLSVMCSP